MMKIKDILRHRHDFALPRAQIAAAVGVSTGTVSHEAVTRLRETFGERRAEIVIAAMMPETGKTGSTVEPAEKPAETSILSSAIV